MLVRLSTTSPYVCDLNRGPIEQANRMASASTKKATALLEQKDSFPKATRAPLKLLAPDEVPIDGTTAPADINASLQPVWYTEQTIVDDQHGQQEDIASIIQEQQQRAKSSLARTTLPPIESESPSFFEVEELPNQPSLMHKSSTFTIEAAKNMSTTLNDSEKENLTENDAPNSIVPPSDDSFRALEHLLGLGSTTTVRESTKNNHDTLSLTVVTPTDIINATTASLRMSIVPKGGSDSLPSSQEIPTMPTIESINSTNPPSFLMDNTTMEEEQQQQPALVAPITAMSQQSSFDLTDNDTMKDDIINDDETNFSFELNDFPNDSKHESMTNVSQPTPPPVVEPMITIRAPTCADVAYRALIKARTGGRVSQPVKADSPLAKSNKLRSSAPTSRMLRSSCRRISTDSEAQNSLVQNQPSSTNECFVEPQVELVEVETLPEEDEEIEQEKTTSVTLNLTAAKPSEEYSTPTKPMAPLLSREYTYTTPTGRASDRGRSKLNSSRATPMRRTTAIVEQSNSPSIASNSMLGVLLTVPTETEPSALQNTLPTSIVPSPVRASTRSTINKHTTDSPSIASKSMLNVLLSTPTEAASSVLQNTPTTPTMPSPVRVSKHTTINKEASNSPAIASKSMLGILLTTPTQNEPCAVPDTPATPVAPSRVQTSTMNEQATYSPSIASKSMLGVLLTVPTEAEQSVAPNTSTAPMMPSPVRASRRTTINKEVSNSPAIASKSMLGILLTTPTEIEPSASPKPSIVPSPVPTSARNTRTSERMSSNPTPRASINPLHSSTPSTSRHRSLQMVSIGEQEQLSTTVPQQVNLEIQEEPEIEASPVDNTSDSLQQPIAGQTIETGVQTTPSLDVSLRRRVNLSEQPIPITIVSGNDEQMSPLQAKAVVNLQRNVRFQLTPSTDARLVAKEQLEECLRGLKPDIVIAPAPLVLETKQPKVKAVKSVSIKKAAKPKRKRLTPAKKIQPKKQAVEKKTPQPTAKGKITKKQAALPPKKAPKKKSETIRSTKRAPRKQPTPKVVPPTKVSNIKPEVVPPTKRAPRKQQTSKVTPPANKPEVVPPVKRTERKPAAKKAAPSTKRVAPEVSPPAKRAPRKRTIRDTTTKAVEPVTKRAKTSKSVEAPTRASNLPKTRSRAINNNKTTEPIVQQVEPKATVSTATTSKRRLPSAEKTKEPKKAVEKGKIEVVAPVQTIELSSEERKKIEALTVAGLQSRLNTHKEEIPKSAKKADLIALLIKIETNLLQTPKQIEVATVEPTATKPTRRLRKN